MYHRAVLQRLIAALLAIAAGMPAQAQPVAPIPSRLPAAAVPAPTPAQPPAKPPAILHYVHNVPGEAAPIILAADEIVTWNESDGIIVLLLHGQCLVQQATFQLRCEHAVARFDLSKFRETGVWMMDLYAEDRVRIDTSADTRNGNQAAAELATRGEIKLRSVKSKLVSQRRSEDALYRRALQERAQALVKPPSGTQQAGYTFPADTPKPTPLPAVDSRATPPLLDPRVVPRAPMPDPRATPPTPTPDTRVVPPAPVPDPRATPPAADPRVVPPAPPTDPRVVPPPPKISFRTESAEQVSPGQASGASAALGEEERSAWHAESVRQQPHAFSVQPNPLACLPRAALAPLACPGLTCLAPFGGVEPALPTHDTSPIHWDERLIVRAQRPDVVPPFSSPGSVPPPPSTPGSPGGGPPGARTPSPLLPARPGAIDAPISVLGRSYLVRPRRELEFQVKNFPLKNGENAVVITGGVIIIVSGVPGIGQVDLEADKCVIFSSSRSHDANTIRQPQSVGDGNRIEFYLAGSVEIREQDRNPKVGERVIRANEIYYDVDRNVAVSLGTQLEMRQPGITDPISVKADEVLRTSRDTYEVTRGEVASSRLPSDPGLKVYFATATIEERDLNKVNLFGQKVVDRATGGTVTERETYIRAHNVFFEVEDIPFFWTPYLAGNARDPLGPVESISGGYNKIYGIQADVTLNMWSLLGVQPIEGTHWKLMLDYLSVRGPGVGTLFDYSGSTFLGLPSEHYEGKFQAWGIQDQGLDNLGGNRPVQFQPTAFRDRALWRQSIYDLPYGITVQSQIAQISDRNFMEAYFKNEWDNDLNRNSFLYAKQQGSFFAESFLVSDRLGRQWVTETEWLPRLDGYLFGVSPFDVLTYNAHASAAFAKLRTSNDPDPGFMPLSPTDVGTNTGRVDLRQDLSYPFYLGPVKFVPYADLDLSAYSQDINGNQLGRIWGGAGVRASIPFTRLYPDVCSELFNVHGINHKITLSGNYFYGLTNDSHYLVPQLDRLNDEAGDQAVRDVRMYYPYVFSPALVSAFNNSPLYDPQVYAMRRLYTTNPDLLDNMDVLQLDMHQRWQTKRGYPGAEHIIDWMTLDLSASVFPQANRDNFGQTLGSYEYDWTWNIGDRTSIISSGLVDPVDNGPKIFTVGGFLNRPDRTSFFLGYRQIEPLESRVISAGVSYTFSQKYAMTFSTTYDFGVSKAQTNSLVFTRTGSDITVSAGFSYNSLQSNFSAILEIVPNLAANTRHGSLTGLGNTVGSR